MRSQTRIAASRYKKYKKLQAGTVRWLTEPGTDDAREARARLIFARKVPETPGRFTVEGLSQRASSTGIGALLEIASASNGVGFKTAKCDGAVWTSRASRSIANSSDLTLYSCLYRYTGGYNLDTYAIFQKTEGGIIQISRDIANSVTGTPESWANKTIVDMVRSIEAKANAKITHLEGEPKIGDLPWIDKIDTNTKVSDAR